MDDIAQRTTPSGKPDYVAKGTVALVVVSPPVDRAAEDEERSESWALSEDAKAAIRSVLGQTTPPDLLLVVNSSDRPILDWEDQAVGSTQMRQVSAPDAQNLGQAVATALEKTDLAHVQWLWLLHEDVAAEPNALEELLEQGQASTNIGALGPKQVGYEEPTRLLEIGIDATRTARRVLATEPDEVDQGQYDDRSDVLAVGTAGMLVRTTAWNAVGPLDPVLGPFGDGLEYGRRLRRAGYRVVVVPNAVIRHRQRSLGDTDDGASSFAKRRTAQLYNWAVAAPPGGVTPLMIWLPVLTLLRSVARLAMRSPRLAWAELSGYAGLVQRSSALFTRRKQIAEVATVPAAVLAPLEADAKAISKAKRHKKRILSQNESQLVAFDAIGLSALRRHRYEAWGTVFTLLALSIIVSIFLWSPFRGGIDGGSWGNLPESWRVLASQAWSGWQLSGDGAVGPASPTLVPLAAICAPFALLGLSPANFALGLLFSALPLALLGGWLVSGLFTRMNLVRAALSAMWAAGGALWLAADVGNLPVIAAFLALPLVLAGLRRGLGPALRVRVEGVNDILVVANPDRLAWVALASLALTVVSAASPVLLIVTLVLSVLMAVREPECVNAAARVSLTLPRRIWSVVMLVAPSIIVLAPTFVGWIRYVASHGTDSASVARFWGWFFGMPVAGSQDVSGPPWWQFLAGYPADLSMFVAPGPSVSASHYAWVVVAVLSGLGLLAWAIFAALRRVLGYQIDSRNLGGAKPSWTLAVVGLSGMMLWALALLGEQLSLPSLTPRGGLPAVLVAAGSLALLSVAAMGDEYFHVETARRESSATAVGITALVASLATLVAVTVPGPLGAARTGDSDTQAFAPDEPAVAAATSPGIMQAEGYFPLIARETQASPRNARVLVLSPENDALRAELLRGAGLQLADVLEGTPASAPNSVAITKSQNDLAHAVAVLISGTRSDAAGLLTPHAVDIILLEGTGSRVTEYANLLDATPGLERIGTVDAGSMWRLRWEGEVPARLALQPEQGELQSLGSGAVAAGQSLRVDSPSTLILSETRDPSWVATFDGEALEQIDLADGSWRQAWEVPPGEGDLTVRYGPHYLPWWQAGLALSAAILIMTAIPWRRKRATEINLQADSDD